MYIAMGSGELQWALSLYTNIHHVRIKCSRHKNWNFLLLHPPLTHSLITYIYYIWMYMEWYVASRMKERERLCRSSHYAYRNVKKNIMVGHFELNSFLLFLFLFCGPLNYFSGTNKKLFAGTISEKWTSGESCRFCFVKFN